MTNSIVCQTTQICLGAKLKCYHTFYQCRRVELEGSQRKKLTQAQLNKLMKRLDPENTNSIDYHAFLAIFEPRYARNSVCSPSCIISAFTGTIGQGYHEGF